MTDEISSGSEVTVETVIGQKYRDKERKVVGTATAKTTDFVMVGGVKATYGLTQLKLDPEHIMDEQGRDLGHHDKRYFPDSRLEAV